MFDTIIKEVEVMGTRNTNLDKHNWFLRRFKLAKAREIVLDEEKMISEFILNLSSTRRTALEILKTYENLGKIKREKEEGKKLIFVKRI